MSTFGERLKELREEAGLTQEELAIDIGVTKNTVYRWETKPNLPKEETRFMLARYFGVTYGFLMGFTDDREELFITEEEAAANAAAMEIENEDHILMLYRRLSPEMQEMIRGTIDHAFLIDRKRGSLR